MRKSALALAGLLLTSSAVLPSAAAATGDLSATSDIRAFWTQYGVAEATQAELEQKFETLGYVDAMRATEPVVDEQSFNEDGSAVTVKTYTDGSISVSTSEQATASEGAGDASILDIRNCTVSTGSGYAVYQNCLVGETSGYVSITFRASYTLVNGATNRITETRDARSGATVGSVTAPTRVAFRPEATSAQEAIATYSTRFESSAASETIYLSLRVRADGTVLSTRY